MTNWKVEPLRALGAWHGGGTPSKSRADFWEGGDVPWLSPKDMGADVLFSTRDHITAAAVLGSSTRVVKPASVAVVVRSGILERKIPVALVPFATTLNQDMKAIECRPDVDPRWVAWGLRASERELLRTARKAGTTVASLEWSRVLDWRLPIPPLDEQRAIVDILEDHLSRLDAADAYLETVTSRLESLRIARWRSAFGGLAGSWVVRPLLEVATIENGQTPRGLAGALLNDPSTESVPFYKVGDMNTGDGQTMSGARFHVTRSTAGSLGLHIRPEGCVLIPKRGGAIGTNKKRLLSTEAAFDLNMMGLRPSSEIRQRYLWHWFDGIDLGAIADGSNVPQINAPQMRRLSLPVPPLDVQDATCNELDVFISQRRAAGVEVRQSRKRAATLRATLLAAAFSGRLTGRTSDMDRVEELVS